MTPFARRPPRPPGGGRGVAARQRPRESASRRQPAPPQAPVATDGPSSERNPTSRPCFGGTTMFSHRISQPRRPANRGASLRLEDLECRWCPSCTVPVTGNTLRIIGDAGDNNLVITDNGAAGIVVTCDGVASPAATGIQRVIVSFTALL